MKNRVFKEKINPFAEFLRNEAAAGLILVLVAALAIILSNLPASRIFSGLWSILIHVEISELNFSFSVLHVINDGLMVLFFFIVGLEIKRELLVGELSSLKKAMLPMFGAAGGMIIPAGIFLLINAGGKGQNGWAIPMATDIAFVVGILILLKSRIPSSLRVYLTALAIVDDIGAILLIALFYTASVSFAALSFAGFIVILLLLANHFGIKNLVVYVLLGLCLWLAFLYSGIHATIAGVILAFTIPARSKLNHVKFLSSTRGMVDEIGKMVEGQDSKKTGEDPLPIIHALEKNCVDVLTPLHRFEISLHPWVAYLILPLFALANAGVVISSNFMDYVFDPLCIGTVLGLFIGKQAGIFSFTYFAVKLKISEMPANTSAMQLYGASVLGGIGFTMSLFIANLAFPDSAGLLDTARIGILIASALSGAVGYLILRNSRGLKPTNGIIMRNQTENPIPEEPLK